jgi:hypothetical protein
MRVFRNKCTHTLTLTLTPTHQFEFEAESNDVVHKNVMAALESKTDEAVDGALHSTGAYSVSHIHTRTHTV